MVGCFTSLVYHLTYFGSCMVITMVKTVIKSTATVAFSQIYLFSCSEFHVQIMLLTGRCDLPSLSAQVDSFHYFELL